MKGLTFKIATKNDYDDFYKIKCDPENVKWSGFNSEPDYNRLKIWYNNQLESTVRTIYLCYLEEQICGFFYLDKISNEEFEAASSGVLKKFAGKGVGTCLVKKRIEIAKEQNARMLSSWIADDNSRSWKRFEKLGFQKTDVSEVRMVSLMGGAKRFHKWILLLRQ